MLEEERKKSKSRDEATGVMRLMSYVQWLDMFVACGSACMSR